MCIKRAGADAILTYAAKDVSKEINNKWVMLLKLIIMMNLLLRL
jgi:hypothetical protein